MTLHERFEAKYIPEPNSGCWLWLGYLNTKGYGSMWFGGIMRRAHIASYIMHRGPIPQGLELDHLCRVRCCVNPDHLEAVTHRTNMIRSAILQTHCKHGHEFTEENTCHAGNQRSCHICHRSANVRYHARCQEMAA